MLDFKIKYVKIRVRVRGNHVEFRYLAHVKSRPHFNIYYPIGKQIIYFIDNKKYIIYHKIPLILHHLNHTIEVRDEGRMAVILNEFIKSMEAEGMPLIQSSTDFDFIVVEDIINANSLTDTTLVTGVVPKQSVLRRYLDYFDKQYGGLMVSAPVEIVFYVRKSRKQFFISTIRSSTKFMYDYQNKNFIYGVNDVGILTYDTITGKITSDLTDNFIRYLVREFMANYPDIIGGNIEIHVLSIRANI